MRALLSILLTLVLIWLGALSWFILHLPTADAPSSIKTDAIIVLTGSNRRVEHGLTRLAEGAAPLLLISGVGQHATLAQMLAAHASPQVQAEIASNHARIVLDYVAETTQSNASQAAAFVKQYQVHSVRLVTSNYHMPRSVLEFKAAIPGIILVQDPVFPEGFGRDEWWKSDATRRLVFSEFNKYFAALFLRGVTN